MSLLFTDKKTDGNYNVERLCCVSKNPITNKVSSAKDFIKFWNLSLFFGNKLECYCFSQREFRVMDSLLYCRKAACSHTFQLKTR